MREATIADIPAIIRLWRMFYEEALFQICRIPFNAESVLETVANISNKGIVFVAEIDDRIVGVIMGMILPFGWNKNYILAMEAIWYVEKEYRGNLLGVKLLDSFEEAGKEKGATHIAMGHMEYMDGKTRKPILSDKGWITTSQYYRKKGYKIMEQHYIKELK